MIASVEVYDSNEEVIEVINADITEDVREGENWVMVEWEANDRAQRYVIRVNRTQA